MEKTANRRAFIFLLAARHQTGHGDYFRTIFKWASAAVAGRFSAAMFPSQPGRAIHSSRLREANSPHDGQHRALQLRAFQHTVLVRATMKSHIAASQILSVLNASPRLAGH